MKKKLIKLLGIMLVVVFTAVGCSDNTTEDKKSEYNIKESNYIHLTMLFPETINPVLNNDKSVGYIMNLIYDGLFEIDEDYNVQPSLAKEYSISSDGKSVKITLNDNAKWHNNKQITSSDVEYTVSLIKKHSDSSYSSLVKNIKSIDKLSNKSFRINLNENDPFIIDKLTFPIVSKDKLSGLKESQITEYENNFIGNGPYKIKKYEDRQYIILERNEEYFGDLPENRKEIYVKMVPDKESQTEMVLSLDSDIANITLADLSKFEDKKEFNVTKYEGRDYEMVMFNYQNEYLDNTDFRKAIISAINREKVIKEAYVKNAYLSTFPLNTTSKYYDGDIKNLPYDEDKAIEYLVTALNSVDKSKKEQEQAETNKANSQNLEGIVEDNSSVNKDDESLTKKEIKEILSDIKLKIIVPKNNEERIKVAQIIRQNLDNIGINVVVKELEDEEFTKALDSKDYDLAIIGYYLSSIPDARDILQGCNIEDKKLSNYIKSLGNSKSEDETKEIYSQIQEYIVNEGSFISLGILDNFVVSNKRLKGTIHPNDFDIYKGISNLQMSK